MFKWNILYFSLCPLPLVLPLDITEKSLVWSSLPFPTRCFYMLIRFPPWASLLQAEQSQLTQPFVFWMLQALNHLCGPSLDSLHYVHVSLELGSPELGPAVRMHLTRAEWRGRITSLDLLATLFAMSLGGCWPSLLWEHVAGSCPAWCPPGLLLQSCFPAS